MKNIAIALCIILTLTGCTSFSAVKQESTHNPDSNEILQSQQNADIFKINNIIYQTNIDWVNQLTLTKDQEIGQITKQKVDGKDLENGMSNKLPVGAKIYTTKERNDILLVEYNGKLHKYLALIEG